MLSSKVTKKQFLDYFPNYLEVAHKLEESAMPYAIFAGSEVWLLTGSRKPTDLDILVRDIDLSRIADLFELEIKTKTGGGVSADFIIVGNIEIVANIVIIKEGRTIKVSLNKSAESKLENLEIDDIFLPMLAPEDTIIIKALLKRDVSEGKYDLQDIDALKLAIPLDMKYLKQRISELGIEVYLKDLIHSLE